MEKKIKDIRINGDRRNRLPGNANISIKGIDRKFSTSKIRRSTEYVYLQVLLVIRKKLLHHTYYLQCGVPKEYINGSLRTTFGEHNTKEDVDFLLDNLERIVKELRN